MSYLTTLLQLYHQKDQSSSLQPLCDYMHYLLRNEYAHIRLIQAQLQSFRKIIQTDPGYPIWRHQITYMVNIFLQGATYIHNHTLPTTTTTTTQAIPEHWDVIDFAF